MKMQTCELCSVSMNSVKKKRFGITLIEILISLVILALAVLPALGTFSTYYGTATRQMEQEMALKIAESVVNQLQALSFGLILDKAIPDSPLDIQTSEGTFSGILKFTELTGTSNEIQINRIKYQIKVEIKELFVPQDLDSPHNQAIKFKFKNFKDPNNPIDDEYESFDTAFIFNVTVNYGGAVPIKLSSFRTDMVK